MGVTPRSFHPCESHRREIKPLNWVVFVFGSVAMSYVTEIGHFYVKFVVKLFLLTSLIKLMYCGKESLLFSTLYFWD
jgi:hypothetical protein